MPRPPCPADKRARTPQRRCPVARSCGGCSWLDVPYAMQLKRKQHQIEELFAAWPVPVDPIVGMEKSEGGPWGYRNKIQLPFAPGPRKGGHPTVSWGIFAQGSHRIVPAAECLVEDPQARPIISFIAALVPQLDIPVYNEDTGQGILRYVLVRTALHTHQLSVTFVINARQLPSEKLLVKKLLEAFPSISTVVVNINRGRTSVILGKEQRVLYGPGYIEDIICGCTFRISSSSFYQINPVQAQKLYQLAIEMAALKPQQSFGDAYCGTGTIGIAAAKSSGARLVGIERNAQAVEDARINAQTNGLDPEQAQFVVGDAGTVFARMARAGAGLDVVFLDPPRAGASQAFLANLCVLGPQRVVYISCNPHTQVRDLAYLRTRGYHVRRIAPVDMFPHTGHIETVVLLERGHARGGGRSPDRRRAPSTEKHQPQRPRPARP